MNLNNDIMPIFFSPELFVSPNKNSRYFTQQHKPQPQPQPQPQPVRLSTIQTKNYNFKKFKF